jgi:hypothetical protein
MSRLACVFLLWMLLQTLGCGMGTPRTLESALQWRMPNIFPTDKSSSRQRVSSIASSSCDAISSGLDAWRLLDCNHRPEEFGTMCSRQSGSVTIQIGLQGDNTLMIAATLICP